MADRKIQYGVLLAIVVILSLILLSIWDALDDKKRWLKQQFAEELSIQLKSKRFNLELWLENEKRYLTLLGREPELVALTRQLLALPGDAESLQGSVELQAVREFFQQQQAFGQTGFFLINREGISIGSQRNRNLGTVNFIAQHYPQRFERVWAGETVFIPALRSDVPIDGQPEISLSLFFAAPVTGATGEVIAIMTRRLLPQGVLSALMATDRHGASGDNYLVSAEGYLLTRNRFSISSHRRCNLRGCLWIRACWIRCCSSICLSRW